MMATQLVSVGVVSSVSFTHKVGRLVRQQQSLSWLFPDLTTVISKCLSSTLANSQITPPNNRFRKFGDLQKQMPVDLARRTFVSSQTPTKACENKFPDKCMNRVDSSLTNGPSIMPDWSVHELYMMSCVGMWDDRSEGSQCIVGYIDTAASVAPLHRSRMPTILVVPGGDGTHSDIAPLLEPLVDRGFRIVIPYLVGMKNVHI